MSAPSLLEALEGRRLFSGLPAFSIGDASFIEGNAGKSYASVVVSLNGRTNKTVSVGYGTADGAATAGGDYDAVAGTLTFAPGETRKSIRVPVRGDRTPESDESLFVALHGAKNARIANGRASLTLMDDEPRIAISGSGGGWEGDSGTTPFTFTVSLSTAYDQPVSVNFATRDHTAVAGDDYLATNGTLIFNPGETVQTVTVMVLGDVVADPAEGFYLDVTGASANAHPTGGLSAYATITDEDGPVDDGAGSSSSGYDTANYYDSYSYWYSYGY
jgi:hypothetical protein